MTKQIRYGVLVMVALLAQYAFADINTNSELSPIPSESGNYTSENCVLSKTDPYDVGEVMHEGMTKVNA